MKNLYRTRSFLSRIELDTASFLFVILFLVLLFRIGTGLMINLFLFIREFQETQDNSISFVDAGMAWVSNNSQWTGEGAQWLWVWLVTLGVAEAERNQSNLKVDFLLEKIHGPVRIYIQIILDLIYFAVIFFIFVLSFEELRRSQHSTPVTLPVSNMVLYLSFTVGFFLLSIRLLRRIYQNFRKLKTP